MRSVRILAIAVLVGALTSASTVSASGPSDGPPEVRFATFNVSLNRDAEGELIADLTNGDAQAEVIAEIIQRNAPDVLLLNEFDFDDDGVALDLFADDYLAVSQNGAPAQAYPYRYAAPSNTGTPSGFDLNNNGTTGGDVGSFDYANDAFGFGFFPGQFGMAVLSKYPIDADAIRTFQEFLWADMPGARLPGDPATAAPADWYSAAELEVVRLSSKSHWDVPVEVDGETIHFLVSHPTPPVFDGPEDRNGLRNADEIRFWADYVSPADSAYIYDDDGVTGGLAASDKFVIAGDQNSDPSDGDSVAGAAQQITESPFVNDLMTPASVGAAEQSAAQGGANTTHAGDPAFDTADFNDNPAPGNLRVDYVLPSKTLPILDSGVYWPSANDPEFALVGTFPFPSSDHRLVYVDVDPIGAPDPEIPEAPFVAMLALSGVAVGGVFLMLQRRRTAAA